MDLAEIESLPIALTVEDLATFPDDGNRYELIEGVLFVSAAPVPRHQGAVGELFADARQATRTLAAGRVYMAPIDVVLGPATLVQPDVIFIRRDRMGILKGKYVEGAPDFIAEVLSPTTRQVDTSRKADLYAKHGVAEYWLLDAEITVIRAFGLAVGRYVPITPDARGRIHSQVIPGLIVNPEDFWSRVDEFVDV